MGRFLESMWCVAACAACLGIAVIGIGCGGEGTGDSRGTRVEGTEPGDCEDGADNDADGLFDCADPSCEASPLCGGSGCADVDCDDANECTTDTCDPTNGACDYAPATDGVPCDFGGLPGVCGAGACGDAMLCAGVDCDDANECTTDTCDPVNGLCDHTNVVDLNACDFGGLPGICTAGVCEDAMLCGGVDCDDGNQCTTDTCDPADGLCDHVDVVDSATCDFGGLPGICTAGVCEDAMLCAGVDCDDGKQCTADTCDPADGLCDHVDVIDSATCDFGGLPGICTAGVCEDAMLCAGVDCDDGNECTEDACDPMDGQCGYADVTAGTTCDFGGLPGVCTAGTCTTGPCATNALCHTCPETFLCETDNDCAFSGYVCIASGCETNSGNPIKQCVPSWAASCNNDDDCPSAGDYDCTTVGAGGKRCLRVAAGCDPSTETYDCAPGFSCEGGACVDRRVPCDSYLDCPKSHVCLTTPVSAYCVRTHRSCNLDEDCFWLGVSAGQFCANVDGDPGGSKECVGQRDSSGDACVSSDCGVDSVCESGASGAFASCGDYGLCLNDGDCGSGFSCVGLWQDGRKECVQTPLVSSCTKVSDCGLQQVCAAPRTGGPPSCQSGSAP